MPISPFTYLDQPSVVTRNQPPALPTFIDGSLVHQGDLNALAVNLDYLYAYTLGGYTTTKPLTMLRQTTPQVIATATPTIINWDTADKNTDGAWSAGTPSTVYVQTDGTYRILAQCGYIPSTASKCTIYVLINGTDVVNNAIALQTVNGDLSQVDITTQLAAGASVQIAFQQQTGSNQNATPQYGGQRLTVEWLCP